MRCPPRRAALPRPATLLRVILLLATLLPATAAPLRAAPVTAEYEAQAAGMTIMRAQVVFDLDAPGGGYHVVARTRLTGLAGIFGGSENEARVEGRWQGAAAQPRRYRSAGQFRGEPRLTELEWGAGDIPALQALTPENDDREPVPDALRRGTVDTLSAMAKLVRDVAATGRCDGRAATFDGRRRTDIAASTVSTEPLSLAGGATTTQLRCTIESRLLAGRRRAEDPERAARPLVSTAWLAAIGPGGAMLPVRIDVPTRWFGTVRIALVRTTAAPGARHAADQGW
jgi:hypothetical protein